MITPYLIFVSGSLPARGGHKSKAIISYFSMEINVFSCRKNRDFFVFSAEQRLSAQRGGFWRRNAQTVAFSRILWYFVYEYAKNKKVRHTKRIFPLLLAVLCVLALAIPAGAADSTVITDMKTDCLVDAGGTCQITQTVSVDIAGTEQSIQLPLAANAKHVNVAGYKYKKTTQDGYTVLVLSSNGGFSGSRTFTISYSLSGLVTEQDKVQTITLPLLAPKWSWAIENYTFTISLPAAFEGYPAFTSGYYADVIEDYMTFTVRDGFIAGSMNTALRDHESLSMTLVVGEGYFSGKYASWSSGWVETVLVLVFSGLALLYWFLTLRSKRLRPTSRSVPPDAALPCDLPYLLAGGTPDFNMLICHWAALGYLTIEMDEKGHVLLHRQVIMGNERKRLEVKIFSSLFSRGDVCDGASLVYKTTAQNAMRAIRHYWDKRLYSRSSGNVKITRGLCALATSVATLSMMSQLLPTMALRALVLILCMVVGFFLSLLISRMAQAYYLGNIPAMILSAVCALALLIASQLSGGGISMLVAVAVSMACGVLTLHGGRRTELGTQLISQSLGFRKGLEKISERHLSMLLSRDGQYFYRLLPYAQAIGLGQDLSRRLGDTELEPCEWYVTRVPAARTALEFYNQLRLALEMLELSIRK